MTYSRKTGSMKWGTRNQRTVHRHQEMAEAVKDVTRMRVPIVEFNMLQRIRYASDYFFTQAERERLKGDRADVRFVLATMQGGAILAAKAAPFVHPRPAVKQSGDSEPRKSSIDIQTLNDDELDALERIIAKSQKSEREAEESIPRTADEYLPSTKPNAEGESKDACKSVGELADKPTNDEPDSKG